MSEKEEEKFLTLARKRFRESDKAERENRLAAIDDLNYTVHTEKQWSEDDREGRDKRPTLVIPKLRKYNDQVVNDERMNTPALKARPVDNGADIETASAYESIFHHIEYISEADSAYATAYDCEVSSGKGYLRVTHDFSSDDSFDQDIFIKRMPDPFIVHEDPSSIEYDYSDGKYKFVSKIMLKEEAEKQYGVTGIANFEEGIGDAMEKADWYLEGVSVRVCEYWYKEPYKKTIAMLSTGEKVDYDEGTVAALKAHNDRLTQQANVIYSQTGQAPQFEPVSVVQTREVKCTRIYMAIISGNKVLEQPTEWVGKYIPIVPFIGREKWVEGKRCISSLIRDGKDAQKAYNYWISALTEQMALQPKTPYIVTEEQIEGHEDEWDSLNVDSPPYIKINSDSGQPVRNQPPIMSSGYAEMLKILDFNIMDSIGIYQSGLGQAGNERSGKAINARARQSDTGTYVFIANRTLSLKHLGRILIDMIPKIYDTERVIRVRGRDGKDSEVAINYTDPTTGKKYNDLTAGTYDIVVEVGPAYSTQRQEAADSMMQFVQFAPNLAPMLLDLIAKYMSWPDSQEVAKRLEAMNNQPPPPPSTADLKQNALLQGVQADNILKFKKMEDQGIAPPQPEPAGQNPTPGAPQGA